MRLCQLYQNLLKGSLPYVIIFDMKQTAETKIPLTDEQLLAIHRDVMDNFPSRPGAILRGFLANILPEPVKQALIPEDKNPLTALPMLGRQLATALIANCGDPIYEKVENLSRELIALSFARQIVIISEKELGITPKQSQSVSDGEKLAIHGRILAAVFASPSFSPALGRHTLNIMAPEADILAHPGRNAFKMAMEAVTEKFRANHGD